MPPVWSPGYSYLIHYSDFYDSNTVLSNFPTQDAFTGVYVLSQDGPIQRVNVSIISIYICILDWKPCIHVMYTCFAFLPKNVYMLCYLIMEVSPPIIALSCPYHFWRLASTNSFYSLFLIVSKFQHRLPNPKYPYFISCGCACLNDQIVVAEESQIANKI